jgi:hypothetical protein
MIEERAAFVFLFTSSRVCRVHGLVNGRLASDFGGGELVAGRLPILQMYGMFHNDRISIPSTGIDVRNHFISSKSLSKPFPDKFEQTPRLKPEIPPFSHPPASQFHHPTTTHERA